MAVGDAVVQGLAVLLTCITPTRKRGIAHAVAYLLLCAPGGGGRAGHGGGHATLTLSPADQRKEGTAFDLPIAVAIIIATRQIRAVDASNILLLGELALDGRLVPVRGALPLVLSAHEHGIREVILPADNAHEVQAVQGMLVYPAHTLYEAVMHLTGAAPLLAARRGRGARPRDKKTA